MTGDLTLHGVTKPLTVTLQRIGSGKDPLGVERTGFETVFSIRRGDFGINAAPGMLGEEVRMIIAFELVK